MSDKLSICLVVIAFFAVLFVLNEVIFYIQ
jgi:hypothetical protein